MVCNSPPTLSLFPLTIDAGREFPGVAFGVPFGVSFGVEDALSTLAFLELDLGVTFELKKALTGVEMFSFEEVPCSVRSFSILAAFTKPVG